MTRPITLAALLLTACEADPNWTPTLEAACDYDYECDPSEVCERGGCWVPCVTDADCEPDEVCAGLVGGDDYDQRVCAERTR